MYPQKVPINKYYQFLTDFPKFMRGHYGKYPDIFRIQMVGYSLYFIHKPEFIKHVLQDNYPNYVKGYQPFRIVLGDGLIVNEGKDWVEKRRIVQPIFTKKNLDRMSVTIAENAASMVEKWHGKSEIDITSELEHLIIGLVAESLFGVYYSDTTVKKIRHNLELINQIGYSLLLSPVRIPNWVAKVPIPNKYSNALNRLEQVVQDTIKQRKTQASSSDDLLGILLDYFSEDPQAAKKVRDETMTFLITGHETVVPVLCWCFYHLGKNREVREKLRREILENGPTGVAPPVNFRNYTYLLKVVNETLRLYPPAYVYSRQSLKADQIGPYQIPAKSTIIINVFGIQHHPKFWKRPNDFIPERFDDFKFTGLNNYTFMPFGAGPRTCVADHLSLYEMTIIIIKVLEKFDFDYIGIPEMPLDAKVTLHPKKHVRLKLH